jgi:Zn-dependent protease
MSWEERDYAGGGSSRGGWGGFSENPMNWSVGLGRLVGIEIRLHMIFLLWIGFRLLTAGASLPFTAQWLFVLFGSVFLHELGHCFAARRVGGHAERVLMWPLGGLASVSAPMRPWPQFVTVVWGPLVNVILFSIAWLLLQAGLGATGSWFSVYQQTAFQRSWLSMSAWLHLIFEMNFYLCLFNLWPMFPMDGGRMLQCALWPKMGRSRSMMATTTVGMVAAIVMGLAGMAAGNWLLMAIALFGYMTCMQERQLVRAGMRGEDGFMGYDFSGGYNTLDKGGSSKEGFWARRKRQKAEAALKRKNESLVAEQEEVDRILAKVHEKGLTSLTRGEKRTLDQASQRQRERDQRKLGPLPYKNM